MDTLDKISILLKEQGKKQKDLTDYLGVTKNAFSNWKSGNNTSYMKKLPQIADFFDVSVDYLLGKATEPDKTGNTELEEYLEELRTRPEMKMLFNLTKNATKEDVEKAVKIIETMLGK